jgi:hypothetical protein
MKEQSIVEFFAKVASLFQRLALMAELEECRVVGEFITGCAALDIGVNFPGCYCSDSSIPIMKMPEV